MSSGSVGLHMLPVIIGQVICGVLIWLTSGREKWKVCNPTAEDVDVQWFNFIIGSVFIFRCFCVW